MRVASAVVYRGAEVAVKVAVHARDYDAEGAGGFSAGNAALDVTVGAVAEGAELGGPPLADGGVIVAKDFTGTARIGRIEAVGLVRGAGDDDPAHNSRGTVDRVVGGRDGDPGTRSESIPR